jgi:DNA-binding response OmpR family regulator
MSLEVLLIANAVEALLLIGKRSPDLLVTDLRMSGMDGFSMLQVLSKAREVVNTRIVVVSGLEAEEIEAKGGVPAGVEVLPKPIPFARLAAIAEEIVGVPGFYLQPAR